LGQGRRHSATGRGPDGAEGRGRRAVRRCADPAYRPSPACAAFASSPSRRADPIEPRRLRRLTREREELGPRIDLHGLSQEKARAALESFLWRACDDGWRVVLVITGKGLSGNGVLKRRAPDWLAEPAIRALVAGVSEAHRRHGGRGALYVTLRRRPD
jgi:DNA-nicking Smr family endonuclease